MQRATYLAFVLVSQTVACSGSPAAPIPAPTSSRQLQRDAGDDLVASHPTSDAAIDGAPDVPSAEGGALACPQDMKLVDGDFCSKVEQTCKRKWNSKYTHKTICMEFEAPSRCVGDKHHRRYCIDTYEWPNVAGQRPEIMANVYQAQVKCASVGKRLCTETEWTQACEGPEMKPFPHGYVRDALKCNGDHLWDGPNLKRVEAYDPEELSRLWKGVRSGSQPNCVSDYGVADMPANVDEVSFNEELSSFSKDKYDNALTGGNWYQGVRNQCRPKVYTHDDGWSYYFVGLRCCAESDGKPSDPRAPRQIAHGWDFQRVESLARFTTAQMREKLDLKREGKCTCSSRDTLCRIMCGDMLGPKATDADPHRTIPPPGRD